MIDPTSKPLPSRRLQQLLSGLRTRMADFSARSSEEVGVLNDQIAKLESEHTLRLEAMRAERQLQAAQSFTDWDETLSRRWDDAELRSFKAVFDTVEREGNLRREAKQAIDEANQEAKKRVADIEQRFLRKKNVPIKQLHATRAASSILLDELAQVEMAAETALAQRSLRITVAGATPRPVSRAVSSAAALEATQAAIQLAREHMQRMSNHPVIKFFESIWWWLICTAVLLVVAASLALSGALPPAPALLAGVVAAVLSIMASLVGIRPWLKRVALVEYPKIRGSIMQGRQLHEQTLKLAVEENDAELKRLGARRDSRFEQVKSWRDSQLKDISRNLEAAVAELQTRAAQEKLRASETLTRSIAETDSEFNARLEQELQTQAQAEKDLVSSLDSDRTWIKQQVESLARGGALRMQVATQKAMQIFRRSGRWCSEHFPDWECLVDEPQNWPDVLSEPILPLGNVDLDGFIPETVKREIGDGHLQTPLLLSPLDDGYLTITGDASRPLVAELVRNLLMRALTTLPAGKTQVCVIDPPGLGRDYGWLMHLGDFDPTLVTHRVWTQTTHIARQLEVLARGAEDFIQQSLRNQYRNIAEYNQDAGALAEPFRFLVWSSFPTGLDDQSWKSLQSLLDTGARCGVISILIIDPAAEWPSAAHRDVVMRRAVHMTCSEDYNAFHVDSPAIANIRIQPMASTSEANAQQLIREVGRRALLASRVEVPLQQMIAADSEMWGGDSSQCLEIPIGQSGVGRTHSLKLGIGTAQHAIIAGKTGSGKSSLLHAMITSAIMKYSPERLRLVLLDFKKGVEFQVYSNAKIPHADIIGIESHREFGLSTLQYVDGCMQRRGEAFRAAGVQDLASWNALHPTQPMPRTLVVIDEFQELFVEEDKLSAQASLFLDRIVRQGRSFGVHAVLSSQTLAGSYSLPRTTLGQMNVRIALQCDPSDAQIIFADDNPAAARLKHPGQAIYNDAGGRIEGNQPMQIGWLAKSDQVELFRQFPAGYRNGDPTTNRLGRTLVYDGNRAATWDRNNAQQALEHATREVNPEAIWCIAGESVAINPAVVFPLTKQTGRNVLLVGADDAQASAVMDVVVSSFVRAVHRFGDGRPNVISVQGGKPTDVGALALPGKWQELDCEATTTDIRGADEVLKSLYEKIQAHLNDASIVIEPTLLNLIQLGRLRSLRREDDFSSFGESELTPDKHLDEILRDGPSCGVFTMIWAEGNSTVSRWLSRTALREIEIRLLMQMSANDSTHLVDSVAASRLGEHVMLLFDEATGQEQRFRPFATGSLTDLNAWSRT